MFNGIFDSELITVISVTAFLLCLGFSLLLGLVVAFTYMFRTGHTKSFVVTRSLLPAVVCVIILLVNGNIGTGVAVGRCLQSCALSLSSRLSKRDRRYLSCYGDRLNHRNGIFGLCCSFFPNPLYHHASLPVARFGCRQRRKRGKNPEHHNP